MKAVQRHPGGSCIQFEQLEGRCLLAAAAWGPFPRLIGQDLAVESYPQINGAGESIAIIDNGVDYLHPMLGQGFGPGHKVIAGYDFADRDADPMDGNGHGTGLAGIVAGTGFTYSGAYVQGMAPKANVVALRINSVASTQQALQWVIDHRAQYNIVAICITPWVGRGENFADLRPRLHTLSSAGVFIAAAVGNNGAGVPVGEPATEPDVYGIGAVGLDDKLASFSQRGSGTDLVAPGDAVTMGYYNATTKQPVYTVGGQGTSWAFPHVVGTAALIKQINPSFTPAQIMSIMQDSGANVYDSVSRTTYKRLNMFAALTLAYQRAHKASGVSASQAIAAGRFGGGLDNDLVYGAEGTLHVAFYNGDNGTLNYAQRNAAGVWSSTQVIDGGGVGQYVSIALDGRGLPGMAYYNATDADLRYAHFDGRSWDVSTIDSTRTTGLYPSLVYGPADTPVVSYYNKSYGDLRLAIIRRSSWRVCTVDAAGDSGRFSRVAIDPGTATPAIAYLDATDNQFKYASWGDATWQSTTVDSTLGGGGYISLAFDASGLPAFSYYEAANADLRFANFDGRRWHVTRVAARNTQGLYSSLIFDRKTGQPEVVYYDRTLNRLMLASQTAGVWQVTPILAQGGTFAAAAARPAGGVTFAALDSETDQLRVFDVSL